MKKQETKEKTILFSLSIQSYILILIALVALIVSFSVIIKPIISELAYREAYVESEKAIKLQKYFNRRYKFAIEEYEKAAFYYPWESHYTVMMNKDIERYLNYIKKPEEKIELIQKALLQYSYVQELDNINPWYYSRIAALQNRMGFLIRDTQPQLGKEYILKASLNTRKASQIDYENPIFLENYANLLHFNKRYTEALYYYKKCTEIDKSYINSYMKMASIYTSLKHYDLALDAYQKADKTITRYLKYNKESKIYKKASKYKDINYQILKLLIKMKQYEQALDFFNNNQKDPHTTIKFSGIAGYMFYKLNDYRKSYITLDYYYSKTEDNLYVQLYTDLLIQTNPKEKIIEKLSRLLSFETLSDDNRNYVKTILANY